MDKHTCKKCGKELNAEEMCGFVSGHVCLDCGRKLPQIDILTLAFIVMMGFSFSLGMGFWIVSLILG